MDRGAWQVMVHGVAKSQTQYTTKRLSVHTKSDWAVGSEFDEQREKVPALALCLCKVILEEASPRI